MSDIKLFMISGNLQANLKTLADLEKLKPQLQQAYEGGSHAG